MRLIGELENSKQAQQFVAYLVTAGILAKAEESGGGGSEIWVHEEDQFSAAVAEFSAFQTDPDDAKYADAIVQAAKITRDEEVHRRQVQKRIMVGTGHLKPKPRLVIGLIVMCVGVAILTDFGDNYKSGLFQVLQFVAVKAPRSIEILASHQNDVDQLGVRLASLKRGEIWRLVTPMLIHHGTMHLLFNMLWLFQLGSLIERRYGWLRLLILILVTAAVSNFVQCVVPQQWDGLAPGLTDDHTLLSMLGGMSGVVYGLLGYVWMKSIYDRSAGFYLSPSTVMFMLGWMVFCMIPGLSENLMGIHVANWAHFIGLVVGIAIGYAPFAPGRDVSR